MKRVLYTVLACAAFLTMLTGTSKKKYPPEAGVVPQITPPSTADWKRHEIGGVSVRVPPGATVVRGDTLRATTITLRTGYRLEFSDAIDFPTTRSVTMYDGFMFEAPDALVVWRTTHCNVYACSAPVAGAPYCVRAFERREDHRTLTLASEECAQVVALVRSIE